MADIIAFPSSKPRSVATLVIGLPFGMARKRLPIRLSLLFASSKPFGLPMDFTTVAAAKRHAETIKAETGWPIYVSPDAEGMA